MNLALRKTWTAEQFLEWKNGQELKHECDRIAPRLWTGARAAHDPVALEQENRGAKAGAAAKETQAA